jgi:hypothetical protein
VGFAQCGFSAAGLVERFARAAVGCSALWNMCTTESILLLVCGHGARARWLGGGGRRRILLF